MVVYLDDIVINSRTLEEYVEHLKNVFKILKQNELYVKKEKCSFAKEEVSFLRHQGWQADDEWQQSKGHPGLEFTNQGTLTKIFSWSG